MATLVATASPSEARPWRRALLWLALVHGANGMRTIIGDYARKNVTKFYLNSLLLLATGFTLVLGTYVLVTFDANIGAK